MKKLFALICVLVMTATTLVSCTVKNESDPSNENTYTAVTDEEEETLYLESEKLYYYQQLYDLFETVQSVEEMDAFNVQYTGGYILNSKKGEPQTMSGLKWTSFLDESLGFAFAEIADEMNANPFANFYRLVGNGWVEQRDPFEKDENGITFNLTNGLLYGKEFALNSPMFSVDEKFVYTEQGCKDFLRTVAALESANLNTQTFIALPDNFCCGLKVDYSEADDCYYCFVL
ncbi:MAG: hypothetical protein IKU19_08525, partial [Clostridia bacterium]|nr:hypothetical protein [Clostridia bacterium]